MHGAYGFKSHQPHQKDNDRLIPVVFILVFGKLNIIFALKNSARDMVEFLF